MVTAGPMRTRLLALLAVSALLFALPAAAQPEADASQQILEDPPGDVEMVLADGSSQPAQGQDGALDLVGAWVEETRDTFGFTLQFEDLRTEEGRMVLDSVEARLHFMVHDRPYQLEFYNYVDVAGDFQGAQLRTHDGDEEWYTVSWQPAEADPDADTLTTHVPRDGLPDQKGASPFPGREIHSFWAESNGMLDNWRVCYGLDCQEPPVRVQDRMPDEGTGDASWTVRLGVEQTGHARLSSPDPVRTSNGEASAFVFPVRAWNTGDEEDLFALQATGVPDRWDVTFPQPSVALGPNETRDVPVLLTTPFGHQHGAIETFLVEMVSVADPTAVGRVEVGLRYTEIPQPAGHHDTVFFHGAAWTDNPFQEAFAEVLPYSSRYVFMNALMDDPLDDGEPVPANVQVHVNGSDDTTFRHTWYSYLIPTLQMGLDFDLKRQGELEVTLQQTVPANSAVVTGELVHLTPWDSEAEWQSPWGQRNATVLATFDSGEPQEVASGGTTFTLPFSPTEASDLISYQKGASLALRLQLDSERVTVPATDADTPMLVPGGHLQMPLLEYKDPIDEAFGGAGLLKLSAVGGADRAVNPGESVLFDVAVENHQEAAETVRLSLAGINADWAELPGGDRVRVAAHGNATVQVAVRAPDGAAHGEQADLILEAAGSGDGAPRALVRLRALVDTETDHEDAAKQVEQIRDGAGKESPVAPLALLVLGVVAVAAWRRR